MPKNEKPDGTDRLDKKENLQSPPDFSKRPAETLPKAPNQDNTSNRLGQREKLADELRKKKA